jgi:catechol 2,3-dioxygenase-like lactoylglutathione lyase family enzyme
MDKIHHVAVQVTNLQETINWYKEEFNCEVSYEDDSWALIKFDNVSLALVLPEQHPMHFAIESVEAEKYGDLVKHRDGTASIYIKDPSGNSVELLKLAEDDV